MNGNLLNAAQAFNLNILRFKNFRDRMKRARDREAGTLQKTVESFKQDASAYLDLLRREPASVGDLYAASSAERLGVTKGSSLDIAHITIPQGGSSRPGS